MVTQVKIFVLDSILNNRSLHYYRNIRKTNRLNLIKPIDGIIEQNFELKDENKRKERRDNIFYCVNDYLVVVIIESRTNIKKKRKNVCIQKKEK